MRPHTTHPSQYQETAAPKVTKSPPKIEAKETVPTVTGKKAPVTKVEGKDLIYVGYGKEYVGHTHTLTSSSTTRSQ